MVSVRQFSLASGEVAPALYARSDQVRYATGLRTCRNFMVKKSGGVDNRPGTTFIGESRIYGRQVRLIPFEFNSEQTYVLEFGHLKLRIIRNGSYVYHATTNIAGVAVSGIDGSVSIEKASGTFSASALTFICNGMARDNAVYRHMEARQFAVSSVGSATTNVNYMNGQPFFMSGVSAGSYTPGGTISEIYEVVSPYAESDLFDLQFVQIADVMYIAHPSHHTYKLTRTGHAAWTFTSVSFDSLPAGTARTAIESNVEANDLPASPAFSQYIKSGGWNALFAANQQAVSYGFDTAANNRSARISAVSGNNLNVIDPSDVVVDEVAASLQKVALNPIAPGGTHQEMNSTAQGREYRYRVCSVADTGEESQPMNDGLTATITGISLANPAVVTCSGGHPFRTGDEVTITGVVGLGSNGTPTVSSFISNRRFRVTYGSTTTFSLDSVDSTSWTAWSSGGTAVREYLSALNVSAPTASAPHVLSWYRPTHTGKFNIYRSERTWDDTSSSNITLYGYVGTVTANTGMTNGLVQFRDTGSAPDYTRVNAMASFQFENKDGEGYPAAIGLYQQRLLLGGFPLDPEAIYTSRVGALTAFALPETPDDDDPVALKLFGRQVNQVRYFVDLGDLLIFTDGGEWVLHGGSNGVLTPTQKNAEQHSYNGSRRLQAGVTTSSTLVPVVADSSIIYCQASGSIIRDIAFDYEIDGYRGNDLTIFSSHLFEGKTITSWAYQRHPNSILWMTRNDGVLLGLTYLREHNIIGWHRHDTDGLIESVVSIRENDLDVLYMSVKRTLPGAEAAGGGSYRYIEKVAPREFLEADLDEDAVFMDASRLYDGRNTTVKTMTISGGTTWTSGENMTLTASGATFISTDDNDGNAVDITGPSGDVVRCTIVAYTSATVVTVQTDKTVPVNMRSVARSTWTFALKVHYGHWRHEGESVSVLSDGGVEANPNDSQYTVRTVTNGAITLSAPGGVVRIGLPYTSDLQTLDLDTAEGTPMTDKRKLVTRIHPYLERSRGGLYATAEPASDTVTSAFSTFASRSDEPPNAVPSLITDSVDIPVSTEWSKGGRVFIRQSDPLPLTVLSIVTSGYITAGR